MGVETRTKAAKAKGKSEPEAPAEKRAKKEARNERLDFRVKSETKRKLERAAALAGMTVSQFVISASVARADAVIEEAETLTLSDRDRNRFLAALDREEPRPNSALRKAFGRHRAATR